MDSDLARYVVRHYGHFMTDKEQLAYRHLFATQKVMKGSSDTLAQQEARKTKSPIGELLSDDPAVRQLALGGTEVFVERTAERIFTEHGTEIVLNRCPQCDRLAQTPKARQCRFCKYDWH